jgi:uncharacterized integral membrane protein
VQFVFFALILLCVAVALFALQNPAPVTVRFWPWEFQASVAVVILGATAAGALIGWALGLVARLRRWQRGRTRPLTPAPAEVPSPADRAPDPPEP